MNRILNVVRVQLTYRATYIGIPLLVLGGSFALSILVFALIPYDGPKYGGGSQAPLWYFAVVGAQALTLSFPFSQALSITRREYFIGTLLTAGVTAAMLSGIFLVGGWIEQLTNGWGVNGYFFALDWVWSAGPLAAVGMCFGMAMLFFVCGFAGATVFKRYGMLGLTIALLAVGLVLVGVMAIVGRTDSWAPFFGWFVQIGPGGLAALMLAIAAALAASAFPLLRRATP
ncbi:hypothetical protein ACIQLJ_02805 [Microbacterium sp. NPDC091313]